MIRRALVFTTAQRYLSMVINFATLAVLSRMLTPQEIGTAAVGTAIAMIAISAREFATTGYVIQRADLTLEDVRGAFTVILVLTILIVTALAMGAPWLASAFGNVGLEVYLQILSITFLVEFVGLAIMALMQRDMAFDKIAIIGIASAALGAAITIALAALGVSYLSLAWGWFSSAVTSAVLAVCLRPDFRIFRPTWRGWRGMLVFGSYNGVVVMLQKGYEALPYLVLGRILSMSAAGIYNRSLNLSQMPQKLILGSIFNLMLPVMASQIRAGLSVKDPYLRAVAYITAVQWPALVLLAILAHPTVRVILGNQWLEAVPIVQIMVLAAMFACVSELNAATLISVGGIQQIMRRSLIAIPVAGVVLCAAAGLSLTAMALSFFLTIPLHEGLMFQAVQRRVEFSWRELAAILQRSAVVTASSAFGPLVLVAMRGFHFDLSIGMAVVAAVLSVLGWIVGLRFTRHPLLDELQHLANAIRHHRLIHRLIATRRSILNR